LDVLGDGGKDVVLEIRGDKTGEKDGCSVFAFEVLGESGKVVVLEIRGDKTEDGCSAFGFGVLGEDVALEIRGDKTEEEDGCSVFGMFVFIGLLLLLLKMTVDLTAPTRGPTVSNGKIRYGIRKKNISAYFSVGSKCCVAERRNWILE
jgi:hypothetical protein